MEPMTSTYESSSACPTRTLNDSLVGMTVATFAVRSQTPMLKRMLRHVRSAIRGFGDYALLALMFPILLSIWIATSEKEVEDD